MPANTLFDLHVKYDSHRTREKYRRNWHYLYDLYPMYLQSMQIPIDTLLEVGIFRGGGTKALHDYLLNTRIIGVDRDLSYANAAGLPDMKAFPRIVLDEADQGDAARVQEIGEKYGPFSVIIDDAGHVYDEQVTCFHSLWPYLSRGGLYFIEDVFSNRKRSPDLMRYFTELAQLPEMIQCGPYQSPYDKKNEYNGGIMFHNGMIVIRKTPDNIVRV